MRKIQRETVVAVPVGQVWEFIADMNNWAHDLPGYCSHETKSDRESIWTLKGDIGILSREIDVRVVITEWVEQNRVRFTVEGVYDPVKGGGQVGIAADGPTQTKLIIDGELEAGGLMAPVINTLLGKMLPGMCDKFVASLCADLAKCKKEGPK